MGVIRVLDPSGHREVEFDVRKPELHYADYS